MRNFSVLSDIEFENLSADVLAAELKEHVERFSRGADGGIDLRWNTGTQQVGLGQAKHYSRSSWSQLHAAAKAELANVENQRPHTYKFFTSFDLAKGQKDTLYSLFKPWARHEDDIFGARDLDAALTRHRYVEQRHVKLWLSTGSELFWATHSDILHRSESLKNDMTNTLGCYVESDAFVRATKILNEHRVCLIAGEPGIGKTVLAQMLVAGAMTNGYTPIEVSENIDEAWAALDNDQLQVFLYDDFLGQISFSERMSKNEDKRLASFVDKVTSAKSKLLIMTTREYILRDARRDYRRLNDLEDKLHFVLELGDYSRRDKADILYNHLWQARANTGAISELAGGGWKKIVDHPGYSPRLIQYCTGGGFDLDTPGYLDRFVQVLDHPETLWHDVYNRHLSAEVQAILVTLVSMPINAPLDDLRTAHSSYCRTRGVQTSVGSFKSGLDFLDQTFINTTKQGDEIVVRFHSPSVAEFLIDIISEDADILADLVNSAAFFEQLTTLLTMRSGGISLGLRRNDGATALPLPLGSVRGALAGAVKRTFESLVSPERLAYQQETYQRFTRPVGILERRLLQILALDAAWQPDVEWKLGALSKCSARWREGTGGRVAAYDLVRGLPAEIRDSEAGADAVNSLEEWLAGDLSETLHWSTYLKLMKSQRGTPYPEELVEAFEEHARDELARWDPLPPDMEDLISHASGFGLSELKEMLEEAAAEDAAPSRDDPLGSPDGPPPSSEDSSDDAIEHIFIRFSARDGLT